MGNFTSRSEPTPVAEGEPGQTEMAAGQDAGHNRNRTATTPSTSRPSTQGDAARRRAGRMSRMSRSSRTDTDTTSGLRSPSSPRPPPPPTPNALAPSQRPRNRPRSRGRLGAERLRAAVEEVEQSNSKGQVLVVQQIKEAGESQVPTQMVQQVQLDAPPQDPHQEEQHQVQAQEEPDPLLESQVPSEQPPEILPPVPHSVRRLESQCTLPSVRSVPSQLSSIGDQFVAQEIHDLQIQITAEKVPSVTETFPPVALQTPVASSEFSVGHAPRQGSECGDASCDADIKDSEDDIEVDMIAPSAHGFYFGKSESARDTNDTNFFEQVHQRMLPSLDKSAVTVRNQTEDEALDVIDSAKYETTIDKNDDDNMSKEPLEPRPESQGRVQRSISVDHIVSQEGNGLQSDPLNDLEEELGENLGEVLKGHVSESKNRQPEAPLELKEIARVSTALTTASSSDPNSDSLPLFYSQQPEDVEQGETMECAGETGFEIDLRPVAAVLFQPDQGTSQDLTQETPELRDRKEQLIKGTSLPTATMVATTSTAACANSAPTSIAGRAARRIAGLGAFRFKAKLARDRVDHGELRPSTEEKTDQAIDLDPANDEAEDVARNIQPENSCTSEKPNTPPSEKLASSIDVKTTNVKSEKSAGQATHQIISSAIQGFKHAILPPRSKGNKRYDERTTISNSDPANKVDSISNSSQQLQNEMAHSSILSDSSTIDVESEVKRKESPTSKVSHLDHSTFTTASPSEACSSPNRSHRSSRKPSEERKSVLGIKKNYVESKKKPDEAFVPVDAQNQPKNLMSIKSITSETHSRSSRASIAPPRTNFLTEDVVKSLARSSCIRYIDATLRSSLRPNRKTPERYRNFPPPMKRSESGRSTVSNAPSLNSPRSMAPKRVHKQRKRQKASDTFQLRDQSKSEHDLKESSGMELATTDKILSKVFAVEEEPPVDSATTVLEEPNELTTSDAELSREMPILERVNKFQQVYSSDNLSIKKQITKANANDSRILRTDHKDKRRKKLCSVEGGRFRSSLMDSMDSPGLKKSVNQRRPDQVKKFEVCGETFPNRVRVSQQIVETKRITSPSTESRILKKTDFSKSCARRGNSLMTRYRPTTRTPRISCVGMNTGSEGPFALDKGIKSDVLATSRARMPSKHTSKLSYAACTLHDLNASRESEKTEISSHLKKPETKSTIRSTQVSSTYSGLHEVTEMLQKYEDLTGVSFQSLSDVSGLVRLFQAPTSSSLPSEGNDSQGGISATRSSSIDEVLEEIKRADIGGTFNEEDESHIGASLNSNEVFGRDMSNAQQVPALPSGEALHRFNSETDAKIQAALQKIRSSLAELQRDEQKSSEKYSTSPSTHSDAKENQELREYLKPIVKSNLSEAAMEANTGSEELHLEDLEAEHMHGLHYTSPKEVMARCRTSERITALQKLRKPNDKRGFTIKKNAWALFPTNHEMVSESVQASALTANVDCQHTESSPNGSNFVSSTHTEASSKSFGHRDTYLSDLTRNISGLDDYSKELIPRSHHDLFTLTCGSSGLVTSQTTSTSSTREHEEEVSLIEEYAQEVQGSSSTAECTAKLKPTGLERAQRRIANLLVDDLPTTALAVLAEIIPTFLSRTKSELECPRQSQLQRILLDKYRSYPLNFQETQNSYPQFQSNLMMEAMVHEVSLLVEDTARAAEVPCTGEHRPA